MAKPENPGQGNGGEGADDDAYAVIVVTEEEEHRYEGTSHIAITADGSLLVGKAPLAAFSAAAWLRAYVEELPPPSEP